MSDDITNDELLFNILRHAANRITRDLRIAERRCRVNWTPSNAAVLATRIAVRDDFLSGMPSDDAERLRLRRELIECAPLL